ncbi:MAG: hypothetical protein ACFFCS_23995, partial [Candidatus Hodarchaeota archaeon]
LAMYSFFNNRYSIYLEIFSGFRPNITSDPVQLIISIIIFLVPNLVIGIIAMIFNVSGFFIAASAFQGIETININQLTQCNILELKTNGKIELHSGCSDKSMFRKNFCIYCGHNLPSSQGLNYCPSCGKKIAQSSTEG